MQTYEEAIKYVVEAVRPKTILELGTGYGISGGVFLDCGVTKLVSVDNKPVKEEKGKIMAHFKAGQEVIFMQEDTMNPLLKDKFDVFDFVYVDAGHTYTECKNDIELAYSKLENGGTILIHDYGHANNKIPDGYHDSYGVCRAVDEFVQKFRNQIGKHGVVPEEHNSFYIIKFKECKKK